MQTLHTEGMHVYNNNNYKSKNNNNNMGNRKKNRKMIHSVWTTRGAS